MAIEIPLHEIIEAAVKSGWEVTEALTAIIEVADNLVLAHGSSAELDALLKGDQAEPRLSLHFIKRRCSISHLPAAQEPKRERTAGSQ
ncbi:hypothetical protein [Neorhizobium galegae]|uniref:hypothetical protein n=1 Tax=Neorhizobium galegae TaxID=399 RepID=UPI002104549B|nr:hypothetical protein [Neorhizobium galegae]